MSPPRQGVKGDDFSDRDYPVREDMRLQLHMWRLERVGWWLLILLVILSLLGLFSGGVLSKARAQNAEGDVAVEYQRFERRGAQSALSLQIKAGGDGRAVVELDGDFLDGFRVEHIHPLPLESHSHGNGVRWVFRPDAEGIARVHLTLRPEGLGFVRNTLATPGSAPMRFSQFIYP